MKKPRNTITTLLKTGFFHIFGSSVINKIVAFLSSVVLVRILTKEEYGIFTYAWNIYSIVILANGLGMENGVLQLCSERSGDVDYARRVTGFGARVGLLWDLLLAAVLLGISLFVPLKIDSADTLLQMLCLLPMVQFLYLLSACYLRSQRKNQAFSKLSTINTVLVFVISVGCAFLFREKGMVMGYYGAYAVSAVVAIFVMKVDLFRGGSLQKQEKKALMGIAVVSMCNNGLSQLMYQLDLFVLGIVDPQETVLASYRVATIIPTALIFIPMALITYVYPYFAEHRNDKQWCLRTYKKILLGLGCFNFALSAVLVAAAPLIVKILFGEAYMDAVPVFRVLSVNYFLSGTFRSLSGNLLVTQRKLKFNLLVAVLSGILNVVGNALLIPIYGPMGAAYATVMVVIFTSVLSTGYLVYTFKKK